MALINHFIEFFRLTEAEKDILGNEIKNENIRRIFYLSLIAIPVSFLHIIFFGVHLNGGTSIENSWRTLIFITHTGIVLVLSPVSLLIYFSFLRKKKRTRLTGFCVYIVICLLLVGGASISAIDQMVTSAINPFIVTCLASSIVLLIRPIYAVLYYTCSYLIFFFLMNWAQPNTDILISNNVNAITFSGLGLCLSFIFWRLFLIRTKQHKLIEEQKNELIENYTKLKFYSEELKESNTTKDKLISVIAHDLRSPLASIINVTNLLTEDFNSMDQAELKKILALLNKETELTFESLNNLLLWSKTQRKRLEPKPEKINLNSLIYNTFKQVKGLCEQKNIAFTNNISNDIWGISDSSMIQSVVKNLLINSIKFTPNGGQIIVDAIAKQNSVEVSIQDNGIGIEPGLLQNLFHPNQSFTSPGTQNESGTGLGLQICKEFIELNHGQIWASSEFGSGSTFYFSLPFN